MVRVAQLNKTYPVNFVSAFPMYLTTELHVLYTLIFKTLNTSILKCQLSAPDFTESFCRK